MAEVLGQPELIKIPEDIDSTWIDAFNGQYGYKGFSTTVRVEEWLEQPEGEFSDPAAFELCDEQGDGNWEQTLSGTVYVVSRTRVTQYHDTNEAFMLALSNASLREADGSLRPLAEGRLVMVRLDRLPDFTLDPPV